MKLIIHIDGGSRGNPGPAGAGVVVVDEDGTVWLEAGYFLGRATNNQAEYAALSRALDAARQLGASEVLVHSDSELLVRQINGDYRVKNPDLVERFEEVRGKLRQLSDWTVCHVPRNENRRADELANLAMSKKADAIETDLPRAAQGQTPNPMPLASTRRSAAAVPAPPPITVICRQPPNPDACPAPCNNAARYVFDKTVPSHVCLKAAAKMCEAVQAHRSGRGDDISRIKCPHPGCGASFEITLD
jgi:ribonuclease HI